MLMATGSQYHSRLVGTEGRDSFWKPLIVDAGEVQPSSRGVAGPFHWAS